MRRDPQGVQLRARPLAAVAAIVAVAARCAGTVEPAGAAAAASGGGEPEDQATPLIAASAGDEPQDQSTTLIAEVEPGHAVTAHARPHGRRLLRIGARTPFGSPTRLAVLARRGRWLAIGTPAPGANRRAWIRRSAALRLRATRYRIVVSLSDRRLELRHGTRTLMRTAVAVGRPTSATPTGRFSVTDKLAGSRYGSAYGCCILALSGVQPHPPAGWTGGNRLALHGTDSPGSIGTASSAGCVRLPDRPLRTLVRRAPLGTEVTIRR